MGGARKENARRRGVFGRFRSRRSDKQSTLTSKGGLPSGAAVNAAQPCTPVVCSKSASSTLRPGQSVRRWSTWNEEETAQPLENVLEVSKAEPSGEEHGIDQLFAAVPTEKRPRAMRRSPMMMQELRRIRSQDERAPPVATTSGGKSMTQKHCTADFGANSAQAGVERLCTKVETVSVSRIGPEGQADVSEERRLADKRARPKMQSPMMQELCRMQCGSHETLGDGVEPQVVDNRLHKKHSLSPAVPGYVPLGGTAYGVPLKRRKALLIGISYSENKYLDTLPGCTNDVIEMFNLLTSPLFDYPVECVKVLSDELLTSEDVHVERPTRFNIVRDLKWLTDGIGDGDGVVFFFAGHGDFVLDTSGDELESGFDQCIMPVDFLPAPKHVHPAVLSKTRAVPPILDDIIHERLVRSVPSGAKVTAIVDACRSGTVCDLPVMYEDSGLPRYRNGGCNPPREWARPYNSAGGFVLFSGSADHQKAADMTIRKPDASGEVESFGVMTKSFVDAVQEMARDRDLSACAGVEAWTYGQLMRRVKEMVRERICVSGHDHIDIQEPQLSSSHHFETWQTPFSL